MWKTTQDKVPDEIWAMVLQIESDYLKQNSSQFNLFDWDWHKLFEIFWNEAQNVIIIAWEQGSWNCGTKTDAMCGVFVLSNDEWTHKGIKACSTDTRHEVWCLNHQIERLKDIWKLIPDSYKIESVDFKKLKANGQPIQADSYKIVDFKRK